MKTKLIIYSLILVGFGFISCKKEKQVTEDLPTAPGSFKEIKTSDNFNWNTSKALAVEVKGMITPNTIHNTLQLGNKDFSAIYYSGFHSLAENVSVNLTIPTFTDSIYLKFGSIQKSIPANGSSAQTDYIINYPEEQQ